jgi:hypothetical protein
MMTVVIKKIGTMWGIFTDEDKLIGKYHNRIYALRKLKTLTKGEKNEPRENAQGD